MDSWIFHFLIFFIAAAVWKLSQRLYLPATARIVRRRASFVLPACKTPIRAYDNIPIISFLILGGKMPDLSAPRFRGDIRLSKP